MWLLLRHIYLLFLNIIYLLLIKVYIYLLIYHFKPLKLIEI